MHFDVIDPEQWSQAPAHLDVIISSVPWELADAILPDLRVTSQIIMCISS
jgi:predicted dinucleotide-binding enzyme